MLSVRYAKRNHESLHRIPLRKLCNIYAKFIAVIVPNFLRPVTKGSGHSSRDSENSTEDPAELDSWPSVEVMMFFDALLYLPWRYRFGVFGKVLADAASVCMHLGSSYSGKGMYFAP